MICSEEMKKPVVVCSLVLYGIIGVILTRQLFSEKRAKPLAASVTKNTKSHGAEPVTIPPLNSIPSVFSPYHSWTATLSASRRVTLIATGDVIPARSVNAQAIKRNNYKWAFEKTADVIKSADVTFINLEAPLFDTCPLTTEGMVFCGSNHHIEGLLSVGVDVVSIANNHAGNYGLEGIQKTVSLLKNNGISITGNNNFAVKNIKGVKMAFLGFNNIYKHEQGISWSDKNAIQKQIMEARQQADLVIVTFHWGTEYQSQPDNTQKDLGHFTIDAGADLVIGNHPHWIQPIEFYHGKLITYVHGNYIFDQMWSKKTREGVIGKYVFFDKKLVDVEYYPLQIDDYGQPHFITQTQKEQILTNMKTESLKLAKSNL